MTALVAKSRAFRLLIVSILLFIVVDSVAQGGDDKSPSSCGGELSMKARRADQMPMSDMMTKLYGPSGAQRVYDRLEELDGTLNDLIQAVAYDIFWARPGLNTRDKSLITIVSLITLEKEEQIKIHLNGFLACGGTLDEVIDTLVFLAKLWRPEAAARERVFVREVLISRQVPASELERFDRELVARLASTHSPEEAWSLPNLSLRDKTIVNVVAAVTLGKRTETKNAYRRFFENGQSEETLRNIIIHQIVYCGFPTAMNGFAALQELHKESQ